MKTIGSQTYPLAHDKSKQKTFPDTGFTSNVSDVCRRLWAASKPLFGFFIQSFFARLSCRTIKDNLRSSYLHKNWLWRVTRSPYTGIYRTIESTIYAEKHRPNRTAETQSIFALGGLMGFGGATTPCWFDSNLSIHFQATTACGGAGRGELPKIKIGSGKSQSIAKFFSCPYTLSGLFKYF